MSATLEQLEKRTERLEAATFTAEQLAEHKSSDDMSFEDWAAMVRPMVTDEERKVIDAKVAERAER